MIRLDRKRALTKVENTGIPIKQSIHLKTPMLKPATNNMIALTQHEKADVTDKCNSLHTFTNGAGAEEDRLYPTECAAVGISRQGIRSSNIRCDGSGREAIH